MKNIKSLFAGAAGLALTSVAFAGPSEDANLSATIGAGSLEIVAASISGTHVPTGGAVSITGADQADALTFSIEDIEVNDLDGSGTGWSLTATPPANLVNGANNLPLGTTAGFNTPSDGPNTTVDSANQITYGSGTGVVGYTIDYDVAYTVPALVDNGTYTGVVTFAVSSN